jgi:hypothetical protein
MVDHEMFLFGLKPALYGNGQVQAFANPLPQLISYPYTRIKHFYLFFQSQTQKDQFIKQQEKFPYNSPEFERLLGYALGYPPLAVEYYTQCARLQKLGNTDQLNDLMARRVALRYAGIRCVSHVDDLEFNIRWLWERYPIQDELKVGIEGQYKPHAFYGRCTDHSSFTATDSKGVETFKKKRIQSSLPIHWDNKQSKDTATSYLPRCKAEYPT